MFDWDEHNLRKIRSHRMERDEVEQALSNNPILIYEQALKDEVRYVYYGESGVYLPLLLLSLRNESVW